MGKGHRVSMATRRKCQTEATKRTNNPYRPIGWQREALDLYLAAEYSMDELATLYDSKDPRHIARIIAGEALRVLIEQRGLNQLAELEEMDHALHEK